jgi:hypothetical protein
VEELWYLVVTSTIPDVHDGGKEHAREVIFNLGGIYFLSSFHREKDLARYLCNKYL